MSCTSSNIFASVKHLSDNLRGRLDGWDFKQYILLTLFYRFISEKVRDSIGDRYESKKDSDVEHLKPQVLADIGLFIYPSQLFENVYASFEYEDDPNTTLEGVFKSMQDSTKRTDSENTFSCIFNDFDTNGTRLGDTVEKRKFVLVTLFREIKALELRIQNNDIFGDLYEFLMHMYASNAGKSGGEFFTPQSVSELLARITVIGKKTIDSVYDPTAGSGSLLLKFHKVLGKRTVINGFFGQEINRTTYNLCKINLLLNHINFKDFYIAYGDTLTEPSQINGTRKFEAIVSNPPYSVKWEGDSNPSLLKDPRFSPAGALAPKSKGDFAFIMHSLYHLADNGTAAIVCFPGIFYRAGAEQKIRKYLVDNNYVDAVIQLSENLFFGTSISTCILVLKKNKQDNKILFVDASREYVRGKQQSELGPLNIHKVLGCVANRESVEHFARLVEHAEIQEHNYKLHVGTYVEPEDTTEKIDIVELEAKIAKNVKRQEELRAKIKSCIGVIEKRNGYDPDKVLP